MDRSTFLHLIQAKEPGKAAEKGAWLEFDGVSPKFLERRLDLVTEMKKHGYLDQIMVSHDAGWNRPSEPGGGAFRGFDKLFSEFLSALKKMGFTDLEIRQPTEENPQSADSIGVRALN